MPDSLATSIAATRSMICSCSASGISSGSLITRHPPATSQPKRGSGMPAGPRSGTEILTGVLEATVRDPSGRGPGARLFDGLEAQATIGVGGQPAHHFHARVAYPTGQGDCLGMAAAGCG